MPSSLPLGSIQQRVCPRNFRTSYLKIEAPTSATSARDTRHEDIVVAILQLGRSLNLEVVAECVETRDQARFLAQVGCDEAYLFAAPAPLETLLGSSSPESRLPMCASIGGGEAG